MTKLIVALAGAGVIAAGLVVAPALGENRVVDVDGFSEIDAANGVVVEIDYGAPASVVIEGPEDRLGNVTVEVVRDTLRVRPRRSGLFGRVNLDDVTVRVGTETLTEIEVANGAVVTASNLTDEVEFEVSVVNGGVIELEGACGEIDASAARGGVLDASGLDCSAAIASASMGGVIEIAARDSVEASASMGGVIEISGAAEQSVVSQSMGGVVSRTGG